MIRILIAAFLMISSSSIAQDTDTLCYILSKEKKDSTTKHILLKRNDFVKVLLKNDTKIKGRISSISENGFKLDTTYVQLENVVRLGMNTKKRRHIGQYLSAWILGIGVTAAGTGFIFTTWSDYDTAVGLWATGAISGIVSTYTIDLAYGKRKKFDLISEKWKINVFSSGSISQFKSK